MIRILLATIKAGGGHVALSNAIQQGLARYYPEVETEISDYMLEVGATRFDRQHKEGWKQALKYPWTARWGQHVIDIFPATTRLIERELLRPFAKMAAADLAERPVDMVVSSHGLITTGLSLAKRDYGLRQPVITCASDTHNLSAYWADTWAERLIVPNANVEADMLRLGMRAEQLERIGYPVQQAFLQPSSKFAAREMLKLPQQFTVLFSLGGEGIGKDSLEHIRTLAASLKKSQGSTSTLVVICGRNRELKRVIDSWQLEHVHAQAFTQQMADFLAAADVVIAKAGAASVHETLAVGRSLLISNYAGLNEKGIVDWLEAENLGHYTPTVAAMQEYINLYQEDEVKLEQVAKNCAALQFEAQTEKVVHAIMRFAKEQKLL